MAQKDQTSERSKKYPWNYFNYYKRQASSFESFGAQARKIDMAVIGAPGISLGDFMSLVVAWLLFLEPKQHTN